MQPKDKLKEYLQKNGHTVQGLRMTMREVIPAYEAQHNEALAKIAKGEKTVPESGAGAPGYNPQESAIRATLSYAFPSASVASNVNLMVEAHELPQLYALLTGQGPDASTEDLQNWVVENKKVLVKAAKEVSTHSSRYANTRTSVGVTDTNLESEALPYLCSATVKTPIQQGYAGNAANAPIARLLVASFQFEGRTNSLLNEIRQGNTKFLSDTGLPEDLLAELAQAISQPAQLVDRVAQVCWPVADGYHALSPLPSVAVLDEIAEKHRYEEFTQAHPGYRLPTLEMRIGGNNPQNVSAFNSATNGSYPVYLSKLYTNSGAAQAQLERRVWAASWLNSIPKAVAEQFNTDMSLANAQAKSTFANRQAERIIKIGLAFAFQVKAALDDGLLTVDEALTSKMEKNLAYRYVVMQDPEAVSNLAAQLVQKTVDSGATELKSDEEKRTLLMGALLQKLNVYKAKEAHQ